MDDGALGLMTHIGTYRDISEMDLPHTWGRRFALETNDKPTLSSSNPYMLVEARGDHMGRFCRHGLRLATPGALTKVTVTDVLPPDSPRVPSFARGRSKSDALVLIAEWLPDQDHWQLSAFGKHAGQRFTLSAPGRPDVHLTLDGLDASSGDGSFQAFGVRVDAEDRNKWTPEAAYTLEPRNTSATYLWTVRPGLSVTLPALGQH
jgi:hypothetical protein